MYMSKMPKKHIDEIFGIKPVSAVPEGMSILYEVTRIGETREQLLRDTDGSYYLAVEPEKAGDIGMAWMSCYAVDRRIIIPVSREGALNWSNHNLYGDDLQSAIDEFGEYAKNFRIVWERESVGTGQEDVHEWLTKSAAGDFVLYSTDLGYLLSNESTMFTKATEEGAVLYAVDVCVYYIPAETARRWAEAYGMDEDTYREVFG